MDKDDVKRIVYNHLKDDYYIKLRALENDIDFFLMYMERNKKSDFRFDLRISHNGSFKAFNDIWKKYGYHKSEVETTFSEYMLLKFIIEDIYNNTSVYTDKEINNFFDYFEKYDETFIEDYIGDFVGCSSGCVGVSKKIEQIRKLKQNQRSLAVLKGELVYEEMCCIRNGKQNRF